MCGVLQMASRWLLAFAQRRAMMAAAPSVVRCIPACLRRWPAMLLQPAPATPELVNRPRERNQR